MLPVVKREREASDYDRYGSDPKSLFSFIQNTHAGGACSGATDLEFVQAGDSHQMMRVSQDTYSTDAVYMFAGNFACKPEGEGGFVSLGERLLHDPIQVPSPEVFVKTLDRTGVKPELGHNIIGMEAVIPH
jgi:hypothetical protein